VGEFQPTTEITERTENPKGSLRLRSLCVERRFHVDGVSPAHDDSMVFRSAHAILSSRPRDGDASLDEGAGDRDDFGNRFQKRQPRSRRHASAKPV
jgi:hypothetical protein